MGQRHQPLHVHLLTAKPTRLCAAESIEDARIEATRAKFRELRKLTAEAGVHGMYFSHLASRLATSQ